MEVNGVTLQLSFEFTETEVKASNTCNGLTTASTSTPVRYTYNADIPNGDSNKVEDANALCEVTIAPSSFDFELVDGKLRVTYQDQTLLFSPQGGTSGLFGTWEVDWDYGTLLWKMGGGKLSATNKCDSGLSASVEVPATFRNHFVVDEEASGGDASCSVGIAKGSVEYRFDGDDLIMIDDGQEVRLSK